MIGSSYFIGWCLTLFWAPRLGDIYGRKKLFAISMVCDLILLTTLLLSSSLNMLIAIIFSLGMLTSLRISVGYIYMMELIPKKG